MGKMYRGLLEKGAWATIFRDSNRLKDTFCNHLKHVAFSTPKYSWKPPFTSCNVQVFFMLRIPVQPVGAPGPIWTRHRLGICAGSVLQEGRIPRKYGVCKGLVKFYFLQSEYAEMQLESAEMQKSHSQSRRHAGSLLRKAPQPKAAWIGRRVTNVHIQPLSPLTLPPGSLQRPYMSFCEIGGGGGLGFTL